MCEEEIIEIINKILMYKKVNGLYASVDIVFEAIQGLLDLYQKEKEKNKELYEDNQKQWAERCKLAIELDNNTVSKDKIREFALSESQADTYNFKTISLDRLLKFLEEE